VTGTTSYERTARVMIRWERANAAALARWKAAHAAGDPFAVDRAMRQRERIYALAARLIDRATA